MTVAATLCVVPGAGHLTRRDEALLFVPVGPDDHLRAAFTAGFTGGELQSVASTVVAAGFQVPAFVAVSWHAECRVMAFGDVDVETDQPTLPMLSGAGSRTWVEHWLPTPTVATIDVTAGAVDRGSDLRAGTVPAGGFRLELRAADASGPRPEPPSIAARTDPTADVGGVRAVAAPFDDDAEDADITLPPPVPSTILPPELEMARRDALVEAKVCSRGHANAPTAAACEVCGELLSPGAASVVNVRRPSLGHLAFDDGTAVELDEELLIGRNPARDTEPERAILRRVRVAGDKVSRSHVTVRFQGWEVLVADCGSTNGTLVVPHPGGQVGTLEPGRPQMVEQGAVVYFGSRSFTVRGRRDTETVDQ